MTVDNKKAKRKPGGGRKPSKPDYNPSAILQNQMDAAVVLYSSMKILLFITVSPHQIFPASTRLIVL